MANPPCSDRFELFEPYQLPWETLDDRGERMEMARKVCARCPLYNRVECLLIAKESDLTRGVWGGKVITEKTRREEKIDVRLRK